MSGPKVVRIVTRDEMLARCQTQLAGVEQALATWIEGCSRHQCASDSDIAATSARMDRLRDLVKRDQFTAFAEQATAEVDYLRDDQRRRMTLVAERAAAQRGIEGRQRQAARSLIETLRSKGVAIPLPLEKALTVAKGSVDAAALQAGFSLLYAQHGSRSDERSSLARKLQGGDQVESFDSWIKRIPAPDDDKRVTQINSCIAELIALDNASAAAEAERLLEAAMESGSVDLMLDSLLLGTVERLKAARARSLAHQEFLVVDAELRSAGLQGQVSDEKGASATAQELKTLIEEMRTALAAHQAADAAGARRRAVLEGLASLGYEVTEGLETAGVDQGKVVLRSAMRPLYGVEVAGNLSFERAQIRAVAFVDSGASADPANDRDAETIWCGEVAKLQEHFVKGGGKILIEKAHDVGATPLKRISVPETEAERNAVRSRPQERRLT